MINIMNNYITNFKKLILIMPNKNYIDKYQRQFNDKNNLNLIAIADFETIIIEKKHFPYSYNIHFNIDSQISVPFITDYKKKSKRAILNYTNYTSKNIDSFFLINEFIQDTIKLYNYVKIYKKKYNINLYIYFHNLSNFDGIFLTNFLIQEKYKIKDIVFRNNSIYKVSFLITKLTNNNKIESKKIITFVDSYKILPTSLYNLAISFKLKNTKEDLTSLFIDINNNPKLLSYPTVKTKLIKYCIKDTVILDNILYKFRQQLIRDYGIDITWSLSIASLSFNIYRKLFLKDNKIEKQLYNTNKQIFIQSTYLGGMCEIYKPYGKNLYLYDINSSYPNVMFKYEFPSGIGKVIKREDIKNINLENFFGFLSVRILVSKEEYAPIIGKKDFSGRLIFPTGEFDVNIFSEELKYAIKNTKTKILKIYFAYEYEKKYLFKEFIDHFYTKRLNAKKNKNNTLQYIYKLILNSLYGRFGLKPNKTITKILNLKELTDRNKYLAIEILYSITNEYIIDDMIIVIFELTNDLIMNQNYEKLEIKNEVKEQINILIRENSYQKTHTNTAVQIASAITAYGRIELDKHKRLAWKNKANIYYCDTDSLVTDKKININNLYNLGELKLEKIIKEAYFLAPKIYAYIDINNIKTIKFKGVPFDIQKNINIDWFKSKLSLQNEKEEISFEITHPIRKNMKKLEILQISVVYKTEAKLEKRCKIYKNNEWTDTKPHNIIY